MKKVFALFCMAFSIYTPLYATLSGSTEWRTIPLFAGIPSADQAGIVLQDRMIPFSKFRHIFNPSLMKKGDGYLLAIREVFPGTGWPIPQSNISLWTLDEDFQLIDQGKTLKLIDDYSEDPRLFNVGDALYLSYHHVTNTSTDWKVEIALSSLDPQTYCTFYTTALMFSESRGVEKNWVPFTIQQGNGKEELYFVYSYNPFKVLHCVDERTGVVELCHNGGLLPLLSIWEKKFGLIRGGTPAIRLENDKYLAIFHSSGGYGNYAMGAIIFEASPFRITKISPYPILYPGVYDSQEGYGSRAIIFPGGLVEDTDETGRDVFHIACGVNDVGVKIVTLDREALFNSLIPVSLISLIK